MKLFEVYETNNSIYYILELLNGGTLAEKAQNFLDNNIIQSIIF